MTEQRRHKRNYLIYYLRVFDRNTDELLGHLVDITTEGLMLVSEKPIEANKVFQLKMDLPEEIRGSKQIPFDAESKWCKNDINPDFYDTGFLLINVSPGDLVIIEQLIRDFFFHTD